MKFKLLKCIAAMLALALAPAVAHGQITITQPSGTDVVRPADEFGMQQFQDSMNMDQHTDLGWFLFSNDSPFTNLSNVSFSGGIFRGTATNSDPNVWILETGNTGGVPVKKTGDRFPIDANRYRVLAIRMRLSGTSQGVRTSDGQLWWSQRTIYDSPVSAPGSFWTYGGWQVYFLDIPSLGLATGTPWSGVIRSLRLDPTTRAGETIEIDWIRLARGDGARTITWSSGSPVDIYLDDDSSAANGTMGMIARGAFMVSRGVTGGSFQFQPGALPAGDYWIAMRRSGTSEALTYSRGFYRVGGIPTFTFTSPSPEGSSDDFATTHLGNPWDMNATSDVDDSYNITGLSVTSVTAETLAGDPLGSVRVLTGTSLASGAVADPYFYPLVWNKRGASRRIDTNRYRVFTFEMALPGARDIARGSVARVIWRVAGETVENVSEDIIINHRAGALAMDTITLDMKALPLEPAGSPSRTGWNGTVDGFRLDPHEFTPATPFYVRRIKLAAFERASSSYAIRWDYGAAVNTSAELSLYYDTDGAGYNGTLIATVDPASGSYTWDTSSLANGAHYSIYAVLTANGTIVNQAYAPWPIVKEAGPGTGTPNPRLGLEAPRNGAAVVQPFYVGGWALDAGAASGTGVDAVHVWAFPNPGSGQAAMFLGSASYGSSRPDVGAAFGAQFTNSGFGLIARGLPPGFYQVATYMRSTVSGQFYAAAANVTVQNNPRMAIEAPGNGALVSQPFFLGGWAIDLASASGPGVSTVHVWAYPTTGANATFLGAAAYGGARPDVAAAFGSSLFTNSGWATTVSGLGPGTYDIVAYARSTVSQKFDGLRAVRVTVR